jgi:hypothetical protein
MPKAAMKEQSNIPKILIVDDIPVNVDLPGPSNLMFRPVSRAIPQDSARC